MKHTILSSQFPEHIAGYTIGGKAANLFRMQQEGFPIPEWVVIPMETLRAIRQSGKDEVPEKLTIPEELMHEITTLLPATPFFAVRSSAVDEDGESHSFAGQFTSELYVTQAELTDAIERVWQSAFTERVQVYRSTNGLPPSEGLAVIVQRMIPAEVAGVAFGIHPVSGNRNQQLISAVFGLGEGLVSGALDADHYTLTGSVIEAEIVCKTHTFEFDREAQKGVVMRALPESVQRNRTLTDAQLSNLQNWLKKALRIYGKPQDMEFAVCEGDLFLLQTRPVTRLDRLTDKTGTYTLWDNSNIIESYPGVTTPLTFSFIRSSYTGAYSLFSRYMGVEERVISRNRQVFENTLGLINGRVYYNLKTWYHMLAMLPGYSINARFMEKMMGVKERFDIPESYRLSRGKAWWRIFKMLISMFFRYKSLPRKRKAFMQLLHQTISSYKSIPYVEKNADELWQLYLSFERTLLNEWKAPLLNDFFAMIWFGRLQKLCAKYQISENPNIHNDLLCGSSDIISTQPIHRSIALATRISNDPELKELFLSGEPSAIWTQLQTAKQPHFVQLQQEISRYIVDFGERCIGELKLETVSYTQNPALFVAVLQSYVTTGVTAARTSGNTEESIRANAELAVRKALSGKWLKQRKLRKTLAKARDLVSSRENLRYERTRAFGIVRELFTAMGQRFYFEGIIAHPRDIFYLTKEEIGDYIGGTAVTQNVQALIDLRKAEYAQFREMPVPSERFATWGAVYHANDFFSSEKIEPVTGDLQGIGCCPGRVRGKARVVTDPSTVKTIGGDILVTSSTDPGWVTLFPESAAILVERGSLLSHSAIVSREMGIPCIVGITGLLKTIRTGDEIEMDGSTGSIRIVHRVDEPTE